LLPNATEYVYFENVSILLDYEEGLLSIFILMSWLRLLKFLRIHPFTGPTVQSVVDTLKDPSVYIFEALIIYIVLTFSLTFNVSFGSYLSDFDNYWVSFTSIFQYIFGNHDSTGLVASNRVFGIFLFVLVAIFLLFILMNLLIGVLSNSYINFQNVNKLRWNRFITKLMIQKLKEADEEKKESSKSKSYRIYSLIRHKLNFIEQAVNEIDSDADDESFAINTSTKHSNDVFIIKSDEELDKIAINIEGNLSNEEDNFKEKIENLKNIQKVTEQNHKDLKSLIHKIDEICKQYNIN